MSHTERYAKDKISKQTGHLRFTRIKFSQGLTYWDTEFLTGVENFNEIILEFHPTQWQWNLPSTSKLTVFVPTCALVNHLKLCLALGTTMSVLSRSVLSNSVIPRTVTHQAPLPWDSPGKNTGTGCHSLLQGILPIQESNLGLPNCRQIISIWATNEVLSYLSFQKFFCVHV